MATLLGNFTVFSESEIFLLVLNYKSYYLIRLYTGMHHP